LLLANPTTSFLKSTAKLKQQRKDFEAALAQQQKQIEAFTAGLQMVNAQPEASKPRTQTARFRTASLRKNGNNE